MTERRVFASLEELSRAAAALIAGAAVEAVRERGVFTLGLSGGSTPVRTYQLLAEAGRPAHSGGAGANGLLFPWAATQVYFCDERCVPPDDPESNFRLVQEALLARAPVPPENVHRIRGEDPDPGRAADAYARLLPARLDLLVLGVGEDGHTASLFPGSPVLGERERRVAAVTGPKPPPRRITLTPPALAAAGRLLVLAAGEGKAGAVARALEGPSDPASCPAQFARRGLWLLDRAAASRLGRG
jgi:6-phosphogluconolactonase